MDVGFKWPSHPKMHKQGYKNMNSSFTLMEESGVTKDLFNQTIQI